MFRKITSLTALLLYMLYIHAQEPVNMQRIDSITYADYLKKDWPRVIREGTNALKAGIDFYYLRMRMGIAWFELKNYRKAIPHFRKAYEMNKQEQVVNEYLYYAYVYSGRHADAGKLRKKMTDSLESQLFKKDRSFLSSIAIHGVFANNPQSYSEQDFSKSENQVSESSSQQITNNYQFFLPEISVQPIPAIKLSMALGRLTKEYTNYFMSPYSGNAIKKHTLNQQQLYVISEVFLGTGWSVWASYHKISLSIPVFYEGLDYGMTSGIYESTIEQKDHVISTGITIDAGPIKMTPYINIGNLNLKEQYIPGIQVSWFPLGNLNLYTITNASIVYEYSENEHKSTRCVLKQEAGVKLISHLWLEASAVIGNLANYSNPQGSIIYNDMNTTTGLYGLRLIVPYSNFKHKVYLSFKSAGYKSQLSPQLIGSTPIKYTTYNLSIGAEWNF